MSTAHPLYAGFAKIIGAPVSETAVRPDPRQIRDPRACPTLEAILADEAEDAMVRHECAEALGAIGAPRSVARPSSRFGPPETVSGPGIYFVYKTPMESSPGAQVKFMRARIASSGRAARALRTRRAARGRRDGARLTPYVRVRCTSMLHCASLMVRHKRGCAIRCSIREGVLCAARVPLLWSTPVSLMVQCAIAADFLKWKQRADAGQVRPTGSTDGQTDGSRDC
jgi:hypothetical protein